VRKLVVRYFIGCGGSALGLLTGMAKGRKTMVYEYEVQTEGGSSFDNLERVGERLQNMLNGEDAGSRMVAGWEAWQVNTLNDH